MDELIGKLLANNMEALQGLEISGSVPVSTDLINGVIAQVLAEGLPGKSDKAAPTPAMADVPVTPKSSSAKLPLDPNALLKLVKRAEVKADNGKIVLQFEVRR